MMTRGQVIVTADDFGLDAEVNAAIVKGVSAGFVSSVSLLVNFPSFGEACELARRHGFADRIGLHFNVTEGRPLTDIMRRCERFCAEGVFVPEHEFSRRRRLSPDERTALVCEAQAQIDAARSAGISLTHLDSHNDVHAEPAIAAALASVARTAGITRIRPARNCGERQGVIRRLQNRCFNVWLRHQGLRQVRYVGTVDDVLWLVGQERLTPTTFVEVVTHPRPGPHNTVADAPFAQSLAARVQRLREALAPLDATA